MEQLPQEAPMRSMSLRRGNVNVPLKEIKEMLDCYDGPMRYEI